ncbi:MAG TPA: hypothetical protein VH186_17145 [Chloroflexia bacterium]|nr:hypothetical protein [Chloroflexia bacterium]
MNIDELLLNDDKHDKISEQVDAIRRSHGKLYPPAYALSWVLANQVVQRYYSRMGLDALPIWRENFGWSQFNLVRASNCQQPPDKTLESQRYIFFDAIAVNWDLQGGGGDVQYDMGNEIWVRNVRPNEAVENAIRHLHLDDLPEFDHSACLHGPHSYAYTKLFGVVTDLICRAPELVGKRELSIDLDSYGHIRSKVLHPLRKAGLAQAGVTREWFELFHVAANSRVFINIFTGDILYTEPDDTARVLDYPGWNERNEEQLMAYFAGMLRIPV